MENSQLWQYFKDQGISQEAAARKVGYTVFYVNQLLLGKFPMTDAARLKFARAYPETARFLIPELVNDE